MSGENKSKWCSENYENKQKLNYDLTYDLNYEMITIWIL